MMPLSHSKMVLLCVGWFSCIVSTNIAPTKLSRERIEQYQQEYIGLAKKRSRRVDIVMKCSGAAGVLLVGWLVYNQCIAKPSLDADLIHRFEKLVKENQELTDLLQKSVEKNIDFSWKERGVAWVRWTLSMVQNVAMTSLLNVLFSPASKFLAQSNETSVPYDVVRSWFITEQLIGADIHKVLIDPDLAGFADLVFDVEYAYCYDVDDLLVDSLERLIAHVNYIVVVSNDSDEVPLYVKKEVMRLSCLITQQAHVLVSASAEERAQIYQDFCSLVRRLRIHPIYSV